MIQDESQLAEVLTLLRQEGSDLWDIEVKRAAGGVPDVKETLCAFANMPEGGTILFGLEEPNFSAVGLSDPATLQQKIASQARQAVQPEVSVEFRRAIVDGKTIIITNVHPLPSHRRPCVIRSTGRAYLRFADGDYQLSDAEIQQILTRRERPRHDGNPVDETSERDLDPDLKARFTDAVRSSSRRLADASVEDILRFKRIVEPDGARLTVAGLYALGRYPQQFLPSLSLTAVLKPGDESAGIRNADRRSFDGPLPVILEDAVDWVLRNVRTSVRFGPDGHGRDVSELPAVAVRELVSNALVHRDLSLHTSGKDVQLTLDTDRLVISNPGGLWGLTAGQLGQGNEKSAVNEFLYEIAQHVRTPQGVRVIEGEGGGLQEVRKALRHAGMAEPRFYDNGVRFTALVPRHSLFDEHDLEWLAGVTHHERLDDLQRQLLVAMRHGQQWTNQQVRQEFGPLDSTQVRSALQGLVGFGLAEAHGERGGTHYGISPHESAALKGPSQIDLFSDSEYSVADVEDPPNATSAEDLHPTHSPSDGTDVSTVTRHGPAVMAALAGGELSAPALSRRTGLTLQQVRYALNPLTNAGFITRDGGQGNRNTVYRLRQ
ncbi:ATP-binding protein [Microbacterium sp. A93]|uniref:ATP-binding protein n=1 Tax=Microbacterium sp. A93 TaxID=3450716 RepID=UPI003F438AD3